MSGFHLQVILYNDYQRYPKLATSVKQELFDLRWEWCLIVQYHEAMFLMYLSRPTPVFGFQFVGLYLELVQLDFSEFFGSHHSQTEIWLCLLAVFLHGFCWQLLPQLCLLFGGKVATYGLALFGVHVLRDVVAAGVTDVVVAGGLGYHVGHQQRFPASLRTHYQDSAGLLVVAPPVGALEQAAVERTVLVAGNGYDHLLHGYLDGGTSFYRFFGFFLSVFVPQGVGDLLKNVES